MSSRSKLEVLFGPQCQRDRWEAKNLPQGILSYRVTTLSWLCASCALRASWAVKAGSLGVFIWFWNPPVVLESTGCCLPAWVTAPTSERRGSLSSAPRADCLLSRLPYV